MPEEAESHVFLRDSNVHKVAWMLGYTEDECRTILEKARTVDPKIKAVRLPLSPHWYTRKPPETEQP